MTNNRMALAPWLLVLAPAGVIAAIVAWRALVAAPDLGALIANRDFANYWMAGKLALSGQAMDLFGPQPDYFRHLTEAFGPQYPWRNWSYPPHAALMFWPLGYLSYPAAAFAFIAVTGAFFAWAAASFLGPDRRFALVAILPFVAANAWNLQNGFLTGGFFLGALALRHSRPIIAGVLLAGLTIKPQLGLLFPLLLLAERRWTMIAAAAVATAAMAGLSAALFGLEAWRGYIAEVAPYQVEVMRQGEGLFVFMLTSAYGYLRTLGLSANVALGLHMLVAAPAVALALWSFLRVADARLRGTILAIATFLVTPYAFVYDFGPAAAALTFLAQRGGREGLLWALVLPLAAVSPLALVPAGLSSVPLAPVALAAALAMALTARPSPAEASG